jgi:hypothetical protein
MNIFVLWSMIIWILRALVPPNIVHHSWLMTLKHRPWNQNVTWKVLKGYETELYVKSFQQRILRLDMI